MSMRSVWCSPCEQRITTNDLLANGVPREKIDDALIAHARRHGTIIMYSVNGGDFIGEPKAFAPITSDEIIDLTTTENKEWTSALHGAVEGQVLR